MCNQSLEEKIDLAVLICPCASNMTRLEEQMLSKLTPHFYEGSLKTLLLCLSLFVGLLFVSDITMALVAYSRGSRRRSFD